VNQNYDGWHVQRNYAVYYSFHQYLLQQGYVVSHQIIAQHRVRTRLAQWRFMDVGGKECQGRLDVGELFEDTAYVDTDRVACGD